MYFFLSIPRYKMTSACIASFACNLYPCLYFALFRSCGKKQLCEYICIDLSANPLQLYNLKFEKKAETFMEVFCNSF